MVFPFQSTRGSGERRKLSLSRVWHGALAAKDSMGRFACNFVRFYAVLVHLTAAWKWEIPLTTLYWLVQCT